MKVKHCVAISDCLHGVFLFFSKVGLPGACLRPQAGGGEIKTQTDTVEKTPDADFHTVSRAFLQNAGG